MESNNFNTTTGDSGVKTASFAGAAQNNSKNRGAMIAVKFGAVSGTTPTCTVQLQWSYDGGTNWINLGPASTAVTVTNATVVVIIRPSNTSQAAGNAPAVLTTGGTTTLALNAPLPKTWRLNYTIGGTSPSFNLTNTFISYIS